jgi:hypothetical protein
LQRSWTSFIGRFPAIKQNEMDPLKAFSESLHAANPSTARVYVSAAKTAMEIVKASSAQPRTFSDLRILLEDLRGTNALPSSVRISPFLRFLEDEQAEKSSDSPEYQNIRTTLLDRIGEGTENPGAPSLTDRRDLALLAGLCAAPDKKSPRRWTKSVLRVTREQLSIDLWLWDRRTTDPRLRLALLYWHTWRERLSRLDQCRLYRKNWASTELLFPNSRGESMCKQALHNALARFGLSKLNGQALTPSIIRDAFLAINSVARTDAHPNGVVCE